MTDEDLAQIITLGHETQRIEFKGPGRRDDGHTMALVVRAILAMANLRGGGSVIIGVVEREDKSLDPLGLSAEQEATWNNFDAVCDQVARYADPSVSFDLAVRTYASKHFIDITIQDFAEVPILCRQGYTSAADPARGRHAAVEVLRRGALYIRGKRKPESVPVSTSEEMRELVDLAVEKGIGRQARLRRISQEASGVAPEAIYDDELRGLK